MRFRAVIFDLWDTLVAWPQAAADAIVEQLAADAPAADEPFRDRLWGSYRASQTGPLETVYRGLGIPDELVEGHVQAWHAFAREFLQPRPGAVEALLELRAHGIRTAVLSNCSEDVPAAWPASPLAGLFDAETFSAAVGRMKPDPEIYLDTAATLGVEPAACLFVGDGANDELAGAARVGMTPVLFAAGPPRWPEVREWPGARVSTIQEVVQLC